MATILVVDDEPDICLLARMTLEHEGHQVLEAGDGAAALAVVEAHHPDALVLDVMMPEVDGWAVLDRLKHSPDEAVRTTPVVLLTALSSVENRARGGIEGAVRYLTKPFAPDDLVEAVRQALEGDPEPVQRRRAQTAALEALARLEKRQPEALSEGPRLRLTGLERGRSSPAIERGRLPRDIQRRIDELTETQRSVLAAVRSSRSVPAAAADLGVSRSNVYASLRRIARKLGLESPGDLVDEVRRSDVFADL
jgi:CheY-like chemotaxis protein/DNA-binding CsgD family transcriptional regulator